MVSDLVMFVWMQGERLCVSRRFDAFGACRDGALYHVHVAFGCACSVRAAAGLLVAGRASCSLRGGAVWVSFRRVREDGVRALVDVMRSNLYLEFLSLHVILLNSVGK